MRCLIFIILFPLIILSCTAKKEVPVQENIEQTILAQERGALDRWSAGDPMGFADMAADDVTYYDDITAQTRIDGVEEFRSYLSSMAEDIPTHTYEIVDPKVQLYGDIAISTLHYKPSIGDEPGPLWKATDVFRLVDGKWRLVHAHWSLVKKE